jgi:pyrroline-5-carboxylate reductase
MTNSILILGGGNMGGAIARALHAAPIFTVDLVEPDADKRAHFAVLGIPVYASLAEAPACDALMLAIKPQQFAELAPTIATTLAGRTPLLLSIMAGVSLAKLHALSPHAVRAMPNLPATIHESMSVLCAPTLAEDARALAESIFAAIGRVAWVADEKQLHAVTAVSGSGPAYLFALMAAMEQAALAQGLHAALAKELVSQTLRGAAFLAAASDASASALCAQVASKGGTTEAALQVMHDAGFYDMIGRAIEAAAARSKQLAP